MSTLTSQTRQYIQPVRVPGTSPAMNGGGAGVVTTAPDDAADDDDDDVSEWLPCCCAPAVTAAVDGTFAFTVTGVVGSVFTVTESDSVFTAAGFTSVFTAATEVAGLALA